MTHARGLFREATDTWQRLPQVPPGSTFDSGSGATRTPLSGPQADSALLRVPTDLAPASIAMTLLGAGGVHLGRTGPHVKESTVAVPFCVPLGHASGCPQPLGVSLGHVTTATGVQAPDVVLNFAVTSASAKTMALVLQWGTDADGGELELALDGSVNRTGHTWHIAVPAGGPSAVVPWTAATSGQQDGLRYGWRADGDGLCVTGRVCVDPYALVLSPPAFPPPCPPGMVPPPALGDVHASIQLRRVPFLDDGATGPALGVRTRGRSATRLNHTRPTDSLLRLLLAARERVIPHRRIPGRSHLHTIWHVRCCRAAHCRASSKWHHRSCAASPSHCMRFRRR